MKPLAFNLKQAKKTASDKQSSTFSLPSGHEIKIIHAHISPLQRKQLQDMPIHKMNNGGNVQSQGATAGSSSAPMDGTQFDQYGMPIAGSGKSAPSSPQSSQGASIASGSNTPSVVPYSPQLSSGSPSFWQHPIDWLSNEISAENKSTSGSQDADAQAQAILNNPKSSLADQNLALQRISDQQTQATQDQATQDAHTLSQIQQHNVMANQMNQRAGKTVVPLIQPPNTGTNAYTKNNTLLPGGDQPSNSGAQQGPQDPNALQSNGLPNVSLGGMYQTGMNAINAQQQAESQQGNANADAAKNYAAQQAIENSQWEDERQSKMQEVQNAINDVQAGHINPNHYLQSMSTGQHIASAIGLILGGAGAHSSGGQNMAMNFLNSQIDRDIQSQRDNQQNNKTVLGAYQNKYQDSVAAEKMAQATQYGIYASKLQQAAAQAQDPMAKARALQAQSQLQSQIYPLVSQANMIQRLGQTGGVGVSPIDLGRVGLINPEEAVKEQGAVDNQKNAIAQGNNVYGQLSQLQTLGSRAGDPIQSASKIGVLNAQLASMVQAANPSERLTPESAKMEILPYEVSLTDNANSIQAKQQGFMNHLQSKYAGQTPNLSHFAPNALPKYNVAAAPVERQAPNGKIALFDPGTKRFLGYK